jgi:hypothetical protein
MWENPPYKVQSHYTLENSYWREPYIYIANVEKALLRRGVLSHIIELILVRSPLYAITVGKASH